MKRESINIDGLGEEQANVQLLAPNFEPSAVFDC